MLKIFTIIALSTMGGVWTDDCNACGPECVPVCGTKRFKLCCFNQMKKKRMELPQIEDDMGDYFPPEHAVLVYRRPEWFTKLMFGDDPFLSEDTRNLHVPLN